VVVFSVQHESRGAGHCSVWGASVTKGRRNSDLEMADQVVLTVSMRKLSCGTTFLLVGVSVGPVEDIISSACPYVRSEIRGGRWGLVESIIALHLAPQELWGWDFGEGIVSMLYIYVLYVIITNFLFCLGS
jgi:hypothetical protein